MVRTGRPPFCPTFSGPREVLQLSLKARIAAGALTLAASSLMVAGPAAASPCASSTAGTQNFADSTTDSESGLAPEITSTTASIDGSCGVSLSYAIPSANLIQDESLSWYLNTDGNAGTG